MFGLESVTHNCSPCSNTAHKACMQLSTPLHDEGAVPFGCRVAYYNEGTTVPFFLTELLKGTEELLYIPLLVSVNIRTYWSS